MTVMLYVDDQCEICYIDFHLKAKCINNQTRFIGHVKYHVLAYRVVKIYWLFFNLLSLVISTLSIHIVVCQSWLYVSYSLYDVSLAYKTL